MPKLQRQSHWARANHGSLVRGRRPSALAPKAFDAWPQRLLSGFRRILAGFFAAPAPRGRRPRAASLRGAAGSAVPPAEGLPATATTPAAEAAKRASCSYYLYPLNAHYEEAITDCIEFLNKSSSRDQAAKANISVARRSCEDFI